MKYAICIPSKGRTELKSYNNFFVGTPKENLFVFVEPSEFDEYNDLYSSKLNIVNIEQDNKGISYSRNFMIKYMKSKGFDYIIMFDDNVSKLMKRGKFNEEKEYYELIKVDNFDNALSDLISVAKIENFVQLGISFSASNWCFKKRTKEKCRVWAIFLLNLEKLDDLNFDVAASVCEDFDFTINLIKHNKKVGVLYDYAFEKEMASGIGGNTDLYNNLLQTKEGAIYLFNKHGRIVKPYFNKKHNIWEIKVNWASIESKKENRWW